MKYKTDAASSEARAAEVLYLYHPQGQAEGKKKKITGAGGARPKRVKSNENAH